jgi:hypothetical protein
MSSVKSALVISVLAFFAMASTAQAVEVKTVYTGLSCVPHYPQRGSDGNPDYIFEYYGSDIINTAPDVTDPATGQIIGYNDLGVNCAINRTLYSSRTSAAYLKSVSVLLLETDPTTWIDTATNIEYGNSSCHTHVEYLTAGSVDAILGPDVYTPPGTAGTSQTLLLPATVITPTIDANYNIHCHIYGNYSSINGYTVIEKN